MHQPGIQRRWSYAAWLTVCTGDVQDGAPAHPPPHNGEGQWHFQPGRHIRGPLHGAEEQAGGASHPSLLDQCTSILWGAELSSRRPIGWMETMLVALPPGELASHLFKAIFLHLLPGYLKDLVAIQFQQLAPMELARFADVI